MTRTRQFLCIVFVAGAAAGLWLWRALPDGPAGHVAARAGPGGSLVASVRSEPRTFNRYFAADRTSELVALLTQAKLVRINRLTQQIEPWLAEEWTRSEDGLTYTLRLREGVRFSDGEPFTSSDVLFAFEAVYDERLGSPLATALKPGGRSLEVAAPDPHTIVIRFPVSFGPGLRILDNLPILPRHRLEGALRAGTLPQAWNLATPPGELAGLGPFIIQEYVSGQRVVLVRNPHYWHTDDAGTPLPYLDRLTLVIVPDQEAEVLRLEAGQTDLMQSEIRPEDHQALRRAAAAGRLQLARLGPRLDADFLWFDLRPQSGKADPRHVWLRHVDFRRAISHAVDRAAFANTVYLGDATPVYGPVSPANTTWYASDAPRYEHDPARARALLEGLGLRDRTGDGRLEDASGRPVRFSILTQRGNTPRERGAAVLQQALDALGITVDVVALEVGALIARFTQGDYDAVYFGFDSSDTDPAVNQEFWLSSGHFHIWNPRQPSPATEWERRIDEVMMRQVTALDLDERRRLFADVQRIFGEQIPVLYFAVPEVTVAMSARVANATPVVISPQVLWNAEVLAVSDGPGRGTE